MTTLPTVLRHVPEARIVWLDAHGDFNTPATTPSGFLGGMCLAAACGRWDAGLGELAVVDPARVVMTGVRDLDGGERVELERAGVGTAPPEKLAGALEGEAIYVHLDLDVLDPSEFPAQFPAPGGLSSQGAARPARRARRGLARRRPRDHRVRGARGRRRARAARRDDRVGRGAAAVSLLRPLVEDLHERRAQARLGGGEEKIAKQHAADKLTARERLALLIDDGHLHRARPARAPALLPARDGGPRTRPPTA